jgi:hypothetical protein
MLVTSEYRAESAGEAAGTTPASLLGCPGIAGSETPSFIGRWG